MEAVRTMVKCMGIIGIFIVSLFIVGIVYYFCINIFSSDELVGLGDFLSNFGQSILPGFMLK